MSLPKHKMLRQLRLMLKSLVLFIFATLPNLVQAVSPAKDALTQLEQEDIIHEILAHRGASGDYPQSSWLAFQIALNQGADTLEMDVHLSKDGHIIVNHDKDLTQTTGHDKNIADLTLAEIKAMDAGYMFSKDEGSHYPFRGVGLEVLALDEVLAYFPFRQLSIEMKVNDEQLADKLWSLLDQNGLHNNVVVASQYSKVLKHFRLLANGSIKTSASITELTGLSLAWATGFGAIYDAEFEVAQIPYTMISKPFLTFLREKGIKSHVWTVNDTDKIKRAFDLGAEGVIGDYPDRIHQILVERGER
ncbi:glycerophosphodiester phosphodiesterase [Shewanella surugensis]|uniref:Glycerophosphodiester phosphodiesterase n=1 Tax=Shewanella surugensis TaxID=212020 RepID=A0ABT0LFW6_9GAMM|nr:glycerophosphodiester phosphodiesterase [Shewanella surugensis]MCL1126588.1 glycerophosphodiester phosphodiesterase [Shewanella surugensis]